MRTVRHGHARKSPVRTNSVLARKARDAVVGVRATSIDTKAAVDREVAFVRRVGSAIVVVEAGAPWRRKAPTEVATAGLEADLALPAAFVGFAEKLRIRARGAKCAGWARRNDATAAAHPGHATRAGLPSGTGPTRAGASAGTARDGRGRSGITTAGHRRSGQQNVSKESHRQPRAAGEPRRGA